MLRGLRREGVPIDAIVGCSVGAIVGAMYAAAGMDPDEMLEASRRLTPLSLLAFAVSRWRLPLASRAALRHAGAIPGYLERLDRASFDRLVVLRPDVRGCGTILSRRADPERLTDAGERAVEQALPSIRAWQR
ncbi:MAG: hypothetical protein AUH92_00055 [Acidobacteria bacterium 13_1_40CM_4_69_4]|nr:MAG: hypothetical protein AUH92_00055 [Acidobacteria bacterium 13_1_40CM_4_69_4]